MARILYHLIPLNPRFVPEEAHHAAAISHLQKIAPKARDIRIDIDPSVQLVMCDLNLSAIYCPACSAALSIDWWIERMDGDYRDGGFVLAEHPLPCCHARRGLHELIYDWFQGFARFSITIEDPGIGAISERDREILSSILKTPLRIVYQCS